MVSSHFVFSCTVHYYSPFHQSFSPVTKRRLSSLRLESHLYSLLGLPNICSCTRLLQPSYKYPMNYNLRLRCLYSFLFTNKAHKVFSYSSYILEYLQLVVQEARRLFTGRQEDTPGSNLDFDSPIFVWVVVV